MNQGLKNEARNVPNRTILELFYHEIKSQLDSSIDHELNSLSVFPYDGDDVTPNSV